MTSTIEREQALQQAAKELDIPPSKYRQAMERFECMQQYLSDGNYPKATPPPDIYLQGSFKLGTEIRPYKDSNDADYDIDMVCCLNHQKQATFPERVKHQVGDRLESRYKDEMDEEGSRCWSVNYNEEDSIGFHIDIVPSVPEPDGGNAIAITSRNANTGRYKWSASNPKDFAVWFRSKNSLAFDAMKGNQKRTIFEANVQDGLFLNRDGIRSIDEVPNIHVKTPLQRAIQLLKRHRDITFCGLPNEKCKPISMIITVLATRIYNNEPTIQGILQSFINTLSSHAPQMEDSFQPDEHTYPLITRKGANEWYIPNPTNCRENFADKWHKEEGRVPHARAKAFFDWIEWVKDDFMDLDIPPDEDSYRRERPNFPLPPPGEVTISGQFNSTQNGIPQSFNSNQPVEKHCNLWFRANINITGEFRVYWQVVNTGQQARDDNALRGKIVESKITGIGGVNEKESTLYAGIHWIRCFIIQDRICVARSHKFVVKIEE